MGCLDDHCHSLAIRIVLNHIKKLEFVNLGLLVMVIFYNDLIILIPLNKLDAIVLRSVDQS